MQRVRRSISQIKVGDVLTHGGTNPEESGTEVLDLRTDEHGVAWFILRDRGGPGAGVPRLHSTKARSLLLLVTEPQCCRTDCHAAATYTFANMKTGYRGVYCTKHTRMVFNVAPSDEQVTITPLEEA